MLHNNNEWTNITMHIYNNDNKNMCHISRNNGNIIELQTNIDADNGI